MYQENRFICIDCFKLKRCKEKPITWFFFYIMLIATISVRLVNLVMNFNQILAKVFWYIGVGGFFVFFVYKFRNDQLLHRELARSGIVNKLLTMKELDAHDYQLLGTVMCMVSSKKDKINYFFVFLFSGLALLIALYMDILR